MDKSTVWTPNTIRENVDNWSLACDAALLRYMEDFSQKLQDRAKNTLTNVDDLFTALDETKITLSNVTNDFMNMHHTQFIESRVYEEDETVAIDAVENEKETSDVDQATENVDLMRKVLQDGLSILGKHFERIEVPNSESDEESEGPSIIVRAKEFYTDRPLPYVIGSDEWNASDDCGLKRSESNESLTEEEPLKSEIVYPTKRNDSTSESELEIYDQPTQKNDPKEDIFGSSSDEEPPNKFAAELATKLGNVVLAKPSIIASDRDVYGEPKAPVVTKPKKESFYAGGLFVDEPPPLEVVDQLSGNKITGTVSSGLFDDVDDEDLWDEAPPKPNKVSGLFDDDGDDDLFTTTKKVKSLLPGPPVTNIIPLISDQPPPTEEEIPKKKPYGGISMLQGPNAELARILKQRQEISDSEEEEEPPKPALFSDNEKPKEVIKEQQQETPEKKKVATRNQPKISLFSDDEDDNNKNYNSLFGDDDIDFLKAPTSRSLFDTEPPPLDDEVPKKTIDIFSDIRNDLFQESTKPKKPVCDLFGDLGEESIFGDPTISESSVKIKSIFEETDKIIKSNDRKNSIEDNADLRKDVIEKPKRKTLLFEDDQLNFKSEISKSIIDNKETSNDISSATMIKSSLFDDDIPPINKTIKVESPDKKSEEKIDDISKVKPKRLLFEDDLPENNVSQVQNSKSIFDDNKDINIGENKIKTSLFDDDYDDNPINLESESIKIGDKKIITKTSLFGENLRSPESPTKMESKKTVLESLSKEETNVPDISKEVPGKLSHNLNINVGALLPGAVRPKSMVESTFPENDKSPAIVKSVSFEAPIENISVLQNLTQDRAKISVKRRPSSRRARQQAVRASLIENTPLLSETPPPLSNEVDDNLNGNSKIEEDTNKNNTTESLSTNDNEVSRNPITASKETKATKEKEASSSLPAFLMDDDSNVDIFNSLSSKTISNTPGNLFDDEDNDDIFKILKSKKKSETPSSKALFLDSDNEETFESTAESAKTPTPVIEAPKITPLKLPDPPGSSPLFLNSKNDEVFETSKTAVTPKPNEAAKSFLDSDSDDLFESLKIPPKVKATKETKASLFGDDSDEELFGGTAKKVIKPISRKKTSLFDSNGEDSDDDLFGSKKGIKGKSKDVPESNQNIKKPVSKVVYDDPLMLGDD